MPGRPLCSDHEAEARGYAGPECARRRAVLRETLTAFDRDGAHERYHLRAAENLERWRSRAEHVHARPRVQVIAGDWGEVTRRLTAEHGACFAVLNMANAFVPGGGYVEGAVAQEENLFRRTDCHFRVGPQEYDARADGYLPAMTRLISGREGRVYFDAARPRVCVRGPEDRSRADLGYAWLPDDEVFPFFELRSAAQDLRGGEAFDEAECRRRIAAQLDTLRAHDVRHAVLGAFGCGAFRNPAKRVARVYREALQERLSDFALVAFAIFHAGYGPDNFAPFEAELRDLEG